MPRLQSCEFDQGNTLDLRDTASVGCVSDTFVSGLDEPNGESDWYDPARDIALPLPGTRITVAALHYGSTMTVGKFRCAVETSGVTCANSATGAGFSMSREAYRIFG